MAYTIGIRTIKRQTRQKTVLHEKCGLIHPKVLKDSADISLSKNTYKLQTYLPPELSADRTVTHIIKQQFQR